MAAQYILPQWINDLTFEDAVKLLLLGFFGQTAPTGGGSGGGIPVTPPTVNSVKVVGVQEVDTWATKSGSYTAVAGALSILFNPSSDFVGTVNGATWSGSDGTAPNQGAVSRTAQPGNALPAFVVTLSAGTFLMAEARPA